jgi:hypothetical protein
MSHLDIAIKHATCVGCAGDALVQLVCLAPGVIQVELAVQVLQLASTWAAQTAYADTAMEDVSVCWKV